MYGMVEVRQRFNWVEVVKISESPAFFFTASMTSMMERMRETE